MISFCCFRINQLEEEFIMEQNDKTYLFERAPVPKAVTSLCIPTILSSLVMVFYNMADTYFVGLLNDPVQNAGVALASPVLMAFNSVIALFGVGTASMMSRALGRKDVAIVRRCSAVGFYCAIIAGILLSVVFTVIKIPVMHILGVDATTIGTTSRYLTWAATFGALPTILNVTVADMVRAEGYALEAGIGTMSGCFLNILLDPIFVLPVGLNMGVAGAGFATFLSNCFACLYFLLFLYRKRGQTHICVNIKMFRPTSRIMKEMLSIGIPAMVNNLLTVISQVVLNNGIALYGSAAIAAMGIAFRVDTIPLNICNGLSSGIMPLIGYNFAYGNTKRMKKAWKFTVIVAVSFISFIALLYLLFARYPIALFINNEDVVNIGARFLEQLCLALPFYSFTSIALGVFQACGMGHYSLGFSLSRQLLLMIPSIIILNKFVGMYGISYCYVISEVILIFASSIILIRLFKRLNAQ
jgi:putative MATE family efflux protein